MKTTNIGAKERIHSIDFTKGILVLLMVFYHSLNYLHYRSLAHDYMAFLPPSFLMITGFLITQIYIPKYGLGSKDIGKRLAVRSLKLLFIFTFLNIVARMIFSKNHYGVTLDLEGYFEECLVIYLIGSPSIVAFEVLLPISYILLMSVIILKLQSVRPYFINLCSIIIFTVCILIEKYGVSIYNLNLISSGIIGMTIGLLEIDLINRLVRYWINLSLLCGLYGGSVFFCGDYYYTQIFSTILSLLIIYGIGVKTYLKSWFPKHISLLGQYSLLSYIIQIAYLQMLFYGAAKWNMDKPNIILTIIIIMFAMWFTVVIGHHARQKYRFINRFYEIVFA